MRGLASFLVSFSSPGSSGSIPISRAISGCCPTSLASRPFCLSVIGGAVAVAGFVFFAASSPLFSVASSRRKRRRSWGRSRAWICFLSHWRLISVSVFWAARTMPPTTIFRRVSAKYDYISRSGKYAQASQEEVLHLESGNMPSFAEADPHRYWEAADLHERSNGRLFRSMTVALPNSLSSAAQLRLAQAIAKHVTGGELPHTLAIHAGRSKEEDVPDNPHFHLVFSERVNDGMERAAEQWFRRAAAAGRDPASGGARKTERTKPREWLGETRNVVAAAMNLAFERAGVDDRVTAESHATQLARAHEFGDTAEEIRLLLNRRRTSARRRSSAGRSEGRSWIGMSSGRRVRPPLKSSSWRTRWTRTRQPRRSRRLRSSTRRSRRRRRSWPLNGGPTWRNARGR